VGPIRLQAKLSRGECGGSFAFTSGTTVIDAALDPQPVTGSAYNASATGTPGAGAGTFTVCAFLDDDERQFATDTDSQITVRPSGATTNAPAGCTRLTRLPKAKHHKIARGGLIYSARVARKHGHATLLVRTRTAAVVLRHHAKPCKLLAIRLPGRHGRVRFAASIRRGSERRTIRY
jgi:hypothetical protein